MYRERSSKEVKKESILDVRLDWSEVVRGLWTGVSRRI